MRIGKIENYYGGVKVKSQDGKFYWTIEDGYMGEKWEEIPEYLFNSLVKYEKERGEKGNAIHI